MAVAVTSMEAHPNRAEILGVLARTVHLDDAQTSFLARAWSSASPDVVAARDQALQPDSPLVCEALAAMDGVAYLFVDDLTGADFVTLPPPVTALALKAVRDAIAGAYARPVLPVRQYDLLMAPWRSVFRGPGGLAGPDFGPHHHDVLRLLAVVPQMCCYRHDLAAGTMWRAVRAQLAGLDRDSHDGAIDRAWAAAVVTTRRRLWRLITRSSEEAYWRRCGQCPRTEATDDELAVLRLCLGATFGALVADVLDADTRDLLARPVSRVLN